MLRHGWISKTLWVKKLDKKGHMVMIPFIWNIQEVISIDIKSRLVIARGCGVELQRNKGYVISFCGGENVLQLGAQLTTKTHWIYTLKDWALWYVNYIWVILLIKEKNKLYLILAQIT